MQYGEGNWSSFLDLMAKSDRRDDPNLFMKGRKVLAQLPVFKPMSCNTEC